MKSRNFNALIFSGSHHGLQPPAPVPVYSSLGDDGRLGAQRSPYEQAMSAEDHMYHRAAAYHQMAYPGDMAGRTPYDTSSISAMTAGRAYDPG